eukprot:TRINITY_DN36941_c0_g1_i1.p1 TRINITY_DN36941_c0_g1~~TRINITY_DN36941_c0_g1_i1.p1  ORF type:complete len:387 (+),score=87.14 TRINITY_DN36941_c0_g1_i1:77-1162(+)
MQDTGASAAAVPQRPLLLRAAAAAERLEQCARRALVPPDVSGARGAPLGAAVQAAAEVARAVADVYSVAAPGGGALVAPRLPAVALGSGRVASAADLLVCPQAADGGPGLGALGRPADWLEKRVRMMSAFAAARDAAWEPPRRRRRVEDSPTGRACLAGFGAPPAYPDDTAACRLRDVCINWAAGFSVVWSWRRRDAPCGEPWRTLAPRLAEAITAALRSTPPAEFSCPAGGVSEERRRAELRLREDGALRQHVAKAVAALREPADPRYAVVALSVLRDAVLCADVLYDRSDSDAELRELAQELRSRSHGGCAIALGRDSAGLYAIERWSHGALPAEPAGVQTCSGMPPGEVCDIVEERRC